ncbi:hypothetical protein PHLGIDRAFT_17748 [Phlebiopsis gigantea 11061_1 CR5-6]|uniref:Hemerythrin-like domain-containing protein n=1 Tax=Phlebiopsis gigantea (strain 11061_1 CR5-6) TaxID=745531 RepID=A0A0C3SDU1_PHLG1|nr:hypothetical protein PHLGIDRAFT_17748 [Phlebiopsis gigantea 11061_1 CR5-6]
MSTPDVLRKALADFEPAAKGAVPKDIYKAQHWEMAGAHACLMNGLLSVYEQATTVPQEKQQDFIGYALLWCATLDHHHEWEETLYYPMFAPKFDTSFIVAEHEGFHDGTVALEEYLISTLPSGAKYGFGKTAPDHSQVAYDGAKVRALIDAFAETLATHLSQEIGYIEPEKIRASGLTEAEMKNISDTSAKHMLNMPPTTFLSYTVLITPKYSQFPPAPGFVKSFLVPYVFSLPTRRFWKFAPKL